MVVGKGWLCAIYKKLSGQQEGQELDWRTYNFAATFWLISIEGDGFKAGIWDTVIPRAIHVERAATKAGQVAELLSSGRASSASGQWNHCKSRIGNAGVTLQVQQQQLQTNEAARVKVADKKVRRCSRY
jgi:hypothetical protein